MLMGRKKRRMENWEFNKLMKVKEIWTVAMKKEKEWRRIVLHFWFLVLNGKV